MTPKEDRAMAIQLAVEDAAPSLRQLAAELGVSYDTLRAYAVGRRNPGRDQLRAFADILERRAKRLHQRAEELRTVAAEGDRAG